MDNSHVSITGVLFRDVMGLDMQPENFFLTEGKKIVYLLNCIDAICYIVTLNLIIIDMVPNVL